MIFPRAFLLLLCRGVRCIECRLADAGGGCIQLRSTFTAERSPFFCFVAAMGTHHDSTSYFLEPERSALANRRDREAPMAEMILPQALIRMLIPSVSPCAISLSSLTALAVAAYCSV